jgi:hypothetical protein
MAVDLTRIRAAVANNRTVDGSAVALLRGIPQLIRDAITADDVEDATNLNALADDLEASSADLAAAVTENTPAAGGGNGSPEPPAEPGS